MSNEISIIDRSPLLEEGLFPQMLRLAEIMSTDKTLPAHLSGNKGGCLRIVEWSYRVGQSPYAIADSTYFVSGKIAMDGKLIAALINSHPGIEGSLMYNYEGNIENPDNFFITVSARKKNETEQRTVKVSLRQGIKDSKGAKHRWESDPQQMLAYYGGRVWARRHAPEIIMGLYTPDEITVGNDDKNISAEYVSENKENSNVIDIEFVHLYQEIKNSLNQETLDMLIPSLKKYDGSDDNKNKLRLAYKERLAFLNNEDQALNDILVDDALQSQNDDLQKDIL